MRKILIFVALIAAGASFVLSGCYKQTDYQPGITALIDTISFSASGNGIQYKFSGDTLYMRGTTSIFTPGTTFTPAISLTVPDVIGTYAIGSKCSAIVYTSATGSAGSPAVSGSITVLNNASGKVQGNFTFTAADGTTVKNANFTANK